MAMRLNPMGQLSYSFFRPLDADMNCVQGPICLEREQEVMAASATTRWEMRWKTFRPIIDQLYSVGREVCIWSLSCTSTLSLVMRML